MWPQLQLRGPLERDLPAASSVNVAARLALAAASRTAQGYALPWIAGEFRKAREISWGEPPHQPTYRPHGQRFLNRTRQFHCNSTDTTWPPSSAALPATRPSRPSSSPRGTTTSLRSAARTLARCCSTTARSPRSSSTTGTTTPRPCTTAWRARRSASLVSCCSDYGTSSRPPRDA